MSETTSDPAEAADLESIELGIQFHGGDTVSVQHIAHGMNPQILIVPSALEDGATVRFDMDVTGFESATELADILESIVGWIRNYEFDQQNKQQDEPSTD